MSDPVTGRDELIGELADHHRGCECATCLVEAEKFVVEHVNPLTEELVAAAWTEGWQSGARDALTDPDTPTLTAGPRTSPRRLEHRVFSPAQAPCAAGRCSDAEHLPTDALEAFPRRGGS